ncbi:hypothetical protein BDA99DRAFT_583096 [Phascolomyces articulosus]|uniref:Uncharacterized protein n=1 Tax=Phascolomyces articulosus TaxID=60185 RepID=A0AAD5PE33_9FUNG|nr:hypothetical protein BDA99DRAFT_583096 [Phascolomyces articulosus]
MIICNLRIPLFTHFIFSFILLSFYLSNDQSEEQYWDHIFTKFIKSGNERNWTVDALNTCFNAISAACSRFSSCESEIERNHRSGESDNDKGGQKWKTWKQKQGTTSTEDSAIDRIASSSQCMSDNAIMSVDMTNMTAFQHAYYKRMHKRIFKRMEREEEEEERENGERKYGHRRDGYG